MCFMRRDKKSREIGKTLFRQRHLRPVHCLVMAGMHVLGAPGKPAAMNENHGELQRTDRQRLRELHPGARFAVRLSRPHPHSIVCFNPRTHNQSPGPFSIRQGAGDCARMIGAVDL